MSKRLQYFTSFLTVVIALFFCGCQSSENRMLDQYFSQALDSQREGNYLLAIDRYDEVLKFTPYNTNILINKGQCYYGLEKYEDALSLFQKCIEHKPTTGIAYLLAGKSLIRLNRPQEAAEYFSQAVTHSTGEEKTDAQLELVIIRYQFQKKYQEAFDLLKEVYTQSPNDEWVMYNYISILTTCPDEAIRDPRLALKLAEKYVKKYPSAKAYFMLGQALFANDAIDQAIAMNRKALSFVNKDDRKPEQWQEGNLISLEQAIIQADIQYTEKEKENH